MPLPILQMFPLTMNWLWVLKLSKWNLSVRKPLTCQTKYLCPHSHKKITVKCRIQHIWLPVAHCWILLSLILKNESHSGDWIQIFSFISAECVCVCVCVVCVCCVCVTVVLLNIQWLVHKLSLCHWTKHITSGYSREFTSNKCTISHLG